MTEDEAKQADAVLDPRVPLAVERTLLAYERTQIAWVRTALALITFGFAIAQFFAYLRAVGEAVPTALSPRTVGLIDRDRAGRIDRGQLAASPRDSRLAQTTSGIASPGIECDGDTDRAARSARPGRDPGALSRGFPARKRLCVGEAAICTPRLRRR